MEDQLQRHWRPLGQTIPGPIDIDTQIDPEPHSITSWPAMGRIPPDHRLE
jgi:hypothetical protein